MSVNAGSLALICSLTAMLAFFMYHIDCGNGTAGVVELPFPTGTSKSTKFYTHGALVGIFTFVVVLASLNFLPKAILESKVSQIFARASKQRLKSTKAPDETQRLRQLSTIGNIARK